MKRSVAICAAIPLLALMWSCSSEPPKPASTRESDIQAIKDIETQWNKDFQAKDVDKIVAHYSDDAVLMPPGAPPSSGKDAIHSAVKELVADTAFSLKFDAAQVDVAKSGDIGYTQGAYTMTMSAPGKNKKKTITDKGSYVTVYKKQADGAWKAVADIVTPAPAAAPPPAANNKKKPHHAAKHK